MLLPNHDKEPVEVDDSGVKTILVSNSELDTEQKCDFRAYLSYGEEIAPKDPGEALSRGIFGHKIFEVYWLARKEGLNHKDARMETHKWVIPETLRIQNPAVTNVHEQVDEALEFFHMHGYQPVEVEETHKYEIPGVFESPTHGKFRIVFCMTPDTILEGTIQDHDKGDLIAVDYKYTGQFWSPATIRLYQQLPKYMLFMNVYEDYRIKRGLLMQINTRVNQSKNSMKIVPKWIDRIRAKEDRLYMENLELCKKYAERKLQTPLEWSETATRTINTKDCGWCYFASDLCPQLLEGRPVATTLKAFYKHNDYGYTL